MATSAQEWRKKREEGVEFVLQEYGDVVRLRPMDAGFFLQAGKLPDFLEKTVQDLINSVIKEVERPANLSADDMKKWLAWLDELVVYTVVEPKVVKGTPQADEISVEEIGLIDKLCIYRFFGQPAYVLRAFRDVGTKPVAVVDAAKNNGAHAEQSAESAALGKPSARNAG